MNAALIGFGLVLIVAIAADYRVLNALICLFKSVKNRALNSGAKGNPND